MDGAFDAAPHGDLIRIGEPRSEQLYLQMLGGLVGPSSVSSVSGGSDGTIQRLLASYISRFATGRDFIPVPVAPAHQLAPGAGVRG